MPEDEATKLEIVNSDDVINNIPINEKDFYRGDKKLPKENAQFNFTPAMVKELKKCRDNIVHFAENHFTIVNLDRGKETIELYPAQKRVLKSLQKERFICLLSSRQAGKSTLATIFALWICCFSSDQSMLIVANKEDTAISIFSRIRLAYELLPNYLKPGVKEWGKTGMALANGSSIKVSTTSSTAARGQSINCLDGDSIVTIIDNQNNIRDISLKDLYVEYVEGYKILNDDGFVKFSGVVKNESNAERCEITCEGRTLKATIDHEIFIDHDTTLKIEKLKIGDKVLTRTGTGIITNIVGKGVAGDVYDVLNCGRKMRFYANGFLVHNCLFIDEAAHIECLHGESVVKLRDISTKKECEKKIGELVKFNTKQLYTEDDLICYEKNDEWEVWTDNGWSNFKGVAKYGKRKLLKIIIDDSKYITVSEKHGFILESGDIIYAEKSLGVNIRTENGIEKVANVELEEDDDYVYDLVDVEKNHRYYANGILNHNTHLLDDFWKSVIPTISSGKKSKIFMVSCVTGDTYIYTPQGVKQMRCFVDDYKMGAYEVKDYEVLGKDKFRRGNIIFNNGKQKTLKITTMNSYLECSEEHKLWACKNGIYDWYKAKDLTNDDYVSIQYGNDVWGNSDNIEFNPNFSNNMKHYWAPSSISTDIGYFLGLFIAEGNVYKKKGKRGQFIGGKVTITCGDFSVNESLKKLGVKVSSKGVRHYINSKHVIEFLEYLGFDLKLKAPKKYIPDRLFSLSKGVIISMLRGLYDGDGCCVKKDGRVLFTSSSIKLIEQVRILLQNLGILSTISRGVSKPTKKVKVSSLRYVLECSGVHAQKFIKTVGFNITRKQINGENIHVEEYGNNTKDVIPFSSEIVKSGLNRGVLYNKLIKNGISTTSLYIKGRKHICRNKMLTIKNLLGVNDISSNLKLLLDNVDENIKWNKIDKIEYRENVVYDFSLPNIEKDDWCHSVIYNGYIGHQTPNGIGNKFYEMYNGAEKGDNGWKAERIDWWDVPGRNEKWKNDMVNTLGSEESFSQEFGNVFLDSATAAVGFDVLEAFKVNKKTPIWKSDDNSYRVYEMPNKDNLYVIGCDVGEGVGRASSTAQVLNITDLSNITQAAVYGSNTIEPYHFANRLLQLCSSWGNPPLLIERNNCGAQTLDALSHNLNYEKLVSYSKLNQTGEYKSTKNLGIFSHNNLRFNAVSNLRYWINFLQVVKIYDTQTISELETFIRYPNGTYRKKGEKFFDDYVMGLVWALFTLDPDLCQQYFTIEEIDEQQKPLKIKRGDYFPNDESLYELKDLINGNVIIPFNEKVQKKHEPLLGDLDIYGEDDLNIEDLLDLGYTIFRP